MSKKFLIADDYTDIPIWDEFVGSIAPTLKSRPQGWKEKCQNLPEGDWQIANAMNPLMPPPKTYVDYGVRYIPILSEMPAVFCVHEDGKFEMQLNVTAQQAGEFINARI